MKKSKRWGFAKPHLLSQKTSSNLGFEKPTIKTIKSAYTLDHENRFPCRTDPNRANEHFHEQLKDYFKAIYLDGVPRNLETDFMVLMNCNFKQQGGSLTDYSPILEKTQHIFKHIPTAEGYRDDSFYFKNFKGSRPCDEKYAAYIAAYQRNSEFLKSYAALAQVYSDQVNDIQKSLRLLGGRYDFEVKFNGKTWKGDAFSPAKFYNPDFYKTLKYKLIKYRYEENAIIVINNGSNRDYNESQNANILTLVEKTGSSAKVIVADQDSIYKLAELIKVDFDPKSLAFKNTKTFYIDLGIPEKYLTCDKSHFEKIIRN